MNRSWFFTLSPSPTALEQQEISLSSCFNNVASNWVTRQLGNTPSYGSCFLQSQCLSQFNSIRFLYKHKTTHSGPLCKMGLILLGERRVLQTNIMGDNQLCNPLCTDLFWHAGMSKYNKTAFLIKEEVINLMICSPCELFTASIPRYTTLLSLFLHIRLLCYYIRFPNKEPVWLMSHRFCRLFLTLLRNSWYSCHRSIFFVCLNLCVYLCPWGLLHNIVT